MIEILDILLDLVFDDLAALEFALRFAWPRVRRGSRRLAGLAMGITVAWVVPHDADQAARDQVDGELRARLEAM